MRDHRPLEGANSGGIIARCAWFGKEAPAAAAATTELSRALATTDLFGARNLGANYGWVFTAHGIADVVGSHAGNTAKTMTGSYQAAFALAGCSCVLSAILVIGLQVARKRATPRA